MVSSLMDITKVLMLKIIGSFFCLIYLNIAFAKDVSLEVLAKRADVNNEMNEDQVLLLNGFRQAVTSELENLKLDSNLYWPKLDKKKMTVKDEFLYLKSFFSNESVIRQKSEGPVVSLTIPGVFKASIDSLKLKSNYEEIILNLEDAKLKTFYVLANIELDKNTTWEDTGVKKSQDFTGVILDSWKKLIEKSFLGFERVVVLENDFSKKVDSMNAKSNILKWKSILKKTSENLDTKTIQYELSAQYILQNAKSGNVLLAFDFPEIKRTFDGQNKKKLSSELASLIYNLFLSQTAKIKTLLVSTANISEMSNIEIKVIGKSSLSELMLVNSFLQENFTALKLSSTMKSYSRDGAILVLRAEGSEDKMIEALNRDGGKFILNEQKILLFNTHDKTFAILPKESNN